MALSKLTISIYFLSVVLFVQMGAGDDPLQLLGIDCRKSNYFPAGAGSRYHKNLNILLSRLQNCRACIGAAIAWIFEKCPLKKRAVALYECCVLIYTHKNIFHKIGDTTYYIYRTQNVTSPASAETITEFLDHLTVEAIATKTYFAKGEVKLAKSESTLYGLVQCASDISPADCKTCMGELMARIPDYTGKGGQFLSATCTLQYEFYRFFNA
ncbi:antimicrobial ginkbilobin-2-like protein [Coffea arabica]|uniref:Antimicrobial ginkbilobin-2-like protein n=1 Tax=Coffea arabica TaxID=13443 RepID=A0A6P6UGL2_COFAR|nr:cysteine-rich repeat secretory protein 38-like [Coffea arabica]